MALSCSKKCACNCLNCLNSFRLDKKLKEHGNVCNNYDYCYIEMPKSV